MVECFGPSAEPTSVVPGTSTGRGMMTKSTATPPGSGPMGEEATARQALETVSMIKIRTEMLVVRHLTEIRMRGCQVISSSGSSRATRMRMRMSMWMWMRKMMMMMMMMRVMRMEGRRSIGSKTTIHSSFNSSSSTGIEHFLSHVPRGLAAPIVISALSSVHSHAHPCAHVHVVHSVWVVHAVHTIHA